MPLTTLAFGGIIGGSVAAGVGISGAATGGVSFWNKSKVKLKYEALKATRIAKGYPGTIEMVDSIDSRVNAVLGFWTFLSNATRVRLVNELATEIDRLNAEISVGAAAEAEEPPAATGVVLVDLSSKFICDLSSWHPNDPNIAYFSISLNSLLSSCLYKVYQSYRGAANADRNETYPQLFRGVEQNLERALVEQNLERALRENRLPSDRVNLNNGIGKIHKVAKAMKIANITSLIDLLKLKNKNEAEAQKEIVDLVEELTSQLAFRFEYAIQDLANHSNILKLVELFAAAIIRNGSKGIYGDTTVEYQNVKMVCILAQLAIPADNDRLYGNSSQVISLKSHRNDGVIDGRLHPTTLAGLVLRSPYEIYPSGQRVESDNRDKYPAQKVPEKLPHLILRLRMLQAAGGVIPDGMETILQSDPTSTSIASFEHQLPPSRPIPAPMPRAGYGGVPAVASSAPT